MTHTDFGADALGDLPVDLRLLAQALLDKIDPVVRLSVAMLADGEDRALAPTERYFVLMPLMHAEDAALQQRCVAEFEALLAEAPAWAKGLFAGAVDYAKRHAAIVERFGRFPHRNAILGRASTPEEVAFLQQPGSSF